MSDPVDLCIERAASAAGPIVWLTGAGISAESGIPTFRGEEGYWRVGSRNYHPQQMATWSAFEQMPDDVWAWYLYRRAVCRAAGPNAAHAALADDERALGDRFLLITQNVDGLHLQAGNSLARTYQIHGNIDFMRCADECEPEPLPLPAEVPVEWARGRPLGPAEREALVCPRCGARARPHVLWFDETYDEEHFRFDSSRRAALETALLIVVGTSGSTNLPMQVGALVARRGAPMIVINPEPNPFTDFAEAHGAFLEGTAGQHVPALARRLEERLST